MLQLLLARELYRFMVCPLLLALLLAGKLPCQVSGSTMTACNATTPGGSGYRVITPTILRQPTNMGTACPEPVVAPCLLQQGCAGKPPRWAQNALLVAPDTWICSADADGVYWHGGNCTGSCMQDTQAGNVTAVCNEGTWKMIDACIPGEALTAVLG